MHRTMPRRSAESHGSICWCHMTQLRPMRRWKILSRGMGWNAICDFVAVGCNRRKNRFERSTMPLPCETAALLDGQFRLSILHNFQWIIQMNVAFSISELISVLDKTKRSSQANRLLLDETPIPASRIMELNELVVARSFPDVPVIFCHLSGSLGEAYGVGGRSPWSVALDPSIANSERSLQETYAHELAHLFTANADHDLRFAIVNSLFRQAAGRENSTNDYDYRDCLLQGYSTEEAMPLSA